ncbi:MAG: hypothetical protein KAW09_03835 [Thermoplasmata archaeon]|nr:hypothetical protein [Thermoplasmata archaeon]
MSKENELFKTEELTVKKIEQKTTRKNDSPTTRSEKLTMENPEKDQILTLKMDLLPEGLAEGTKAVVLFVKEQTTLDQESDEDAG